MKAQFSQVLDQFLSNPKNDPRGKVHARKVQGLLSGESQPVVDAAFEWVSQRPCALQVELEVARALMHTHSVQGLDRSTRVANYMDRLQGLGYSI